MNRSARLILLAALAALAAAAVPAWATWEWTETDWSLGGYAAADSVDADIEPGELVLWNDPDRFVFSFDATDDYVGVWALRQWRDQLYVGIGNWPMSIDDAGIEIYDGETHAHWFDYFMPEQGIAVLRVHDDVLYSPGIDASVVLDFGNIYWNAGNDWVKKATIVRGWHVDDIAFWEGKTWVSTGTGLLELPGVLFSTTDMGDTWTEEFRVEPVPPDDFRRLLGMHVYGGSLWVMNDNKLPEGKSIWEFQPGGGPPILHSLSLSGAEHLAGFVTYQGKMVMLTRTILNVYDGSSWHAQVVPTASSNFVTRGIGLYRDRCYIGGQNLALWTTDLATWTEAPYSPAGAHEFKAFEQYQGRFYAGTIQQGHVFVTPAAPEGSLVSLPHEFPAPVCGGLVDWDGYLPTAAAAVELQLRSALTEAGLAGAPWLGPDGSGGTWYTLHSSAMSLAHCGDSWFQYRVRLSTADEAVAPVVREITITGQSDPTAAPGGTPGSALELWPNPFGAALSIRLPAAGHGGEGSLAIFDVRGRRVLSRIVGEGQGSVTWDGREARGGLAAPGIYLVRYESSQGQVSLQRAVLLR